ncbi:MAG: CDP-glucose 4,6-dehydratase [Verrucomicrobiota bacterium]
MNPSLRETYQGRKVLVTGDTGFKGSWLCEILLGWGAEVHGIALEPNTTPALYTQLDLGKRIQHTTLDIRNAAGIQSLISALKPDFIFHLAAQSLVRESYVTPLETFDVNLMGTLHILEAMRSLDRSVGVMITTDKCYENREMNYAYQEEDPMGGYDPYSASKATAEIGISSYRRSFFKDKNEIGIASARAGNVIGGGDWAKDRILPDSMRSLAQGDSISVRNPRSTRPWQHVLEPLGGYLKLGASLDESIRLKNRDQKEMYRSAFNFGPTDDSNRTVEVLVEEVLKHWSGSWENLAEKNAPHEAGLLHLNINKAREILKWTPHWNFETTIQKTVEWYKMVHEKKESPQEMTRRQIKEYFNNEL